MTDASRELADDAAFRQLFDAQLGFVWRALRRHGVGDADLDDACQEVFLVVHRRLPEFEGRSALSTWIYGIALRVAQSSRRRAHETRELLTEPQNEVAILEPTQFGHALHSQALRELNAALATLPAEQSEVFVLYELEGMSMAEVAAALELPENTALYRLYAAREAIKAFMRKREQRANTALLQARSKHRWSR